MVCYQIQEDHPGMPGLKPDKAKDTQENDR